jgi:hypothetical protein
MLKLIRQHDNRFTRQPSMSLREEAALNVLMTKGIVTETRSDSSQGASLMIAEDALLHLSTDER